MTKNGVIDKNHDSMGLLRLIEKLIYTRGMNDLHTRHNKAIANLKRTNLIKNIFYELELHFIRLSDKAAVLKKKYNKANSITAKQES